MNKMTKKLTYTIALLLALCSCESKLDITPKGNSILNNISELDQLLNNKWELGEPGRLCLLVNECYTDKDVNTVLSHDNTIEYINLSYDETKDRAAITNEDTYYSKAYEAIYYANTILDKADNVEGDESLRSQIKAEAHVLRAYMHYLLVNIFASQYDKQTATKKGGVPYVKDVSVIGTEEKKTVQEVYDLILADLSDDIIEQLPSTANVIRGSKAWGYAVKAKALFQMKEYAKALPYAHKSLEYNGNIVDRRSIQETTEWVLGEKDESNIMYMPAKMSYPYGEMLSLETLSLYETGDLTMDYAQDWGYPVWDEFYGAVLSGVPGCKFCSAFSLYWNNWGVTSDRMYYLTAECLIRTGKIAEGLALVNQVRERRIAPDCYTAFSAENEKDAMALLQKAKMVECIACYENFFDRKRWNTEKDYMKTITRTLPLTDGDKSFSIRPDSPLWIFPFPLNATRHNPNLTQNYE